MPLFRRTLAPLVLPALTVALLAALSPARSAVDLQWDAPQACASEAEITARIEALLERGGSGRQDPAQLALTVRADGEMYTLEVRDVAPGAGDATRTVHGTSCDEVAEAAVLIAAIAIDPGLTILPAETSPDSEPAPPPSEPTDKPEDQPPAPAPDPPQGATAEDDTPRTEGSAEPVAAAPSSMVKTRRRIAPLLGVHAGPTFGLLANAVPSLGADMLVGGEWPRLRLGARLRGAGPSFGDAPDGPGGGSFGHAAAGVVACYRSPTRPWSVVGCAATDVGFVAGRGRGPLQSTRRVLSAWWGLEGEVGVEREVTPRLSLAARGAAGLTIANPDLVVDGQGRVCCESWSGSIRLGIVIRLGRFAAASPR